METVELIARNREIVVQDDKEIDYVVATAITSEYAEELVRRWNVVTKLYAVKGE